MRPIFIRKPQTLQDVSSSTEYARQKSNGPIGEEAYIAEELTLGKGEWNSFLREMLKSRDWLAAFSAKNYRACNGAMPCLRITCPDAEFALLIDTSGYDYARYVAFDPT